LSRLLLSDSVMSCRSRRISGGTDSNWLCDAHSTCSWSVEEEGVASRRSIPLTTMCRREDAARSGGALPAHLSSGLKRKSSDDLPPAGNATHRASARRRGTLRTRCPQSTTASAASAAHKVNDTTRWWARKHHETLSTATEWDQYTMMARCGRSDTRHVVTTTSTIAHRHTCLNSSGRALNWLSPKLSCSSGESLSTPMPSTVSRLLPYSDKYLSLLKAAACCELGLQCGKHANRVARTHTHRANERTSTSRAGRTRGLMVEPATTKRWWVSLPCMPGWR
jgi:hypothetical protein